MSNGRSSIWSDFTVKDGHYARVKIFHMKNLRTLILLAILFAALITHAGESPVAISVDTRNPGQAISPDFAGLSFEVSVLFPNENGVRYFRPDNQYLINLFHTLGIKNLRIGGNTSDRDARKLPSSADIDSLFAFAKAADIKVIYCLRLHNGDPQADAETVKYIMAHYAPLVDAFSIGQEPSAYPVEKTDTRPQNERMGAENERFQYSTYRDEWKKFADIIVAAEPEVKFSGPGVHNNGAWAQKFMSDFAASNHVALITEHLYPGGSGDRVPTPEIGRDRMLGTNFIHNYQRLYNSFVPMVVSNNLPYRLEEVNNYFNGGATNVSNTFASALWGLDFMYWWAAHGAAGLNFHTGDRVAAGNALRPSKYTAFFSTTNGYTIRPLGYGIKAFSLGAHGQFVPTTISNSDNLNLSIYAVLDDDQHLCLTLINKEHGSEARDAAVSITQNGVSFSHGQIIFLKVPDNDIAATSDVTLGDAQIQNDGTWNGNWSLLNSSTVMVPAATAAIIRLPAN
ncbi:MAG TPA: hypothetical protein VMH87_18935 [Pseudomonadales bacterium]|nr:hypothetical protein [Pseudomonadales bacterium]